MRRILLLITDLRIGGTPTVVRELAIRLAAAGGAKVEVACLSNRGPVADQLKQAGIRVTALDARGARDFPRTVWRLCQLVRDHRIDTVFSFLMHANAVAAAASRIRPGVRWLQSIQTTQPTPRWHWRVQSIAQHAAQRIVVPSDSVARVARDWAGAAAEKIVVIPNAVDVPSGDGRGMVGQTFLSVIESAIGGIPASMGRLESARGGQECPPLSDSKQAGMPAPPLPPSTPSRIGFIGRLDPIKRIGDLLQAMTLLDPSTHLHIFGEGAQRAGIEAIIHDFHLNDRVTLHGTIARPDEALSQIDVLVLPSQAEGFGLVLIEAMAAGVPVVATDVPGIRDVVRNGETGLLVPVASPAALAQAIKSMLNDSQLRDRLIANGREDVRRRFSWDIVLPRYQKLLEIA
jgi:glycosyltransferase involved in cell wall biosynthesis